MRISDWSSDVCSSDLSFAKFLMYRDLDPSTWPDSSQITDRALVRGLLQDGFQSRGSMVPEDANIDPFILPSDMLHILDSDSSQALAIHEVIRGRDMVIKGPPGPGKSQPLAHLIAPAGADGERNTLMSRTLKPRVVVTRRI